jgi:hypothetical protein
MSTKKILYQKRGSLLQEKKLKSVESRPRGMNALWLEANSEYSTCFASKQALRLSNGDGSTSIFW